MAESDGKPDRWRWLLLLAVVLLIALTGYSRLTAPWQMGVVGDEMHHLESWRNRYRTDDVYPHFVRRVEERRMLEGEALERFRSFYHSSPLVPRALFIIVDPQPPLFPTIAEAIEAVSRSNLIAARMPSLLASILAVWLMYLVGRELVDRTLGLWLAALLAIGLQAQIYAGVARPYGLAQCFVILTIWAFLREQRRRFPSPRRLYLAALLAQATQWFAWAIVGPLIVIELVRRWRGGSGPGLLFRQTWWYALLSFVLLGVMGIQLMNPTVSGQAESRALHYIWYFFSWASPFSAIDPILGITGFGIFSVAGLLTAFLIVAGGLGLLIDRDFFARFPDAGVNRPTVLVALVATFLAAIVATVFIGSSVRFMMTYLVVPTIFAGIGLRWVLRPAPVSHAGIAAVVGLFLALRIWWPEHPHERIFSTDIDYETVAKRVEEELGPDGTWIAFPYHYANCLYRYADLPEPILPDTRKQLAKVLATLPREEGPTVVFTRWSVFEESRVLWSAEQRWDMGSRYVLLRFDAKEPRRSR